jgi:hypothetical protein
MLHSRRILPERLKKRQNSESLGRVSAVRIVTESCEQDHIPGRVALRMITGRLDLSMLLGRLRGVTTTPGLLTEPESVR